jgi:hypothetical protein
MDIKLTNILINEAMELVLTGLFDVVSYFLGDE